MGARFSRVGPSKNWSGTRSAAASEKNTVKNGRVALSGAASERPRKIDRRPGGPPGAPKISKGGSRGQGDPIFLATVSYFFAFLSLGCAPVGSRGDSGGSGDPPGPDVHGLLRYFLDCSVEILARFAGFRRDVAGISATHSPGFPPGYGDLAERFK